MWLDFWQEVVGKQNNSKIMIQEIITYAIVTITVILILLRFFRKPKKKKTSICDGCDGCDLKKYSGNRPEKCDKGCH